MTTTTRLCAEELFSKWGFGDGDMLFDRLYDLGLSDVDDSEVLCRCVEKYLAPLLPDGQSVERIHSHHNPIRISTWSREVPNWALDCFVDLTDEQIKEVALEVQAEASAVEGGKAVSVE